MIGVVTLALAATAADARKSFDEISEGLNDNDSGYTSSHTSSSGTKHVSASVRCSSSAWADSYKSHENSYISAGVAPLPQPPQCVESVAFYTVTTASLSHPDHPLSAPARIQAAASLSWLVSLCWHLDPKYACIHKSAV